MKIIEKVMKGTGAKVLVFAEELVTEELVFCDIEVASFDDAQLRELIVYLKKNRPELICPIMCDDCPEHICQNYQTNESERGHKNR